MRLQGSATTSVPITFRTTIAMKTIHGAVGRTPRSARVPRTRLSKQADVGVGSGPGGPPHFAFKMFSRVSAASGDRGSASLRSRFGYDRRAESKLQLALKLHFTQIEILRQDNPTDLRFEPDTLIFL